MLSSDGMKEVGSMILKRKKEKKLPHKMTLGTKSHVSEFTILTEVGVFGVHHL
jgi:hypothetical protein